MLAATINSITSWSVGLMTATFAANYYIKSQNKNRSTSDKNHDYGNILFSTSASILIGQILHNTINFINPMASFCVIFTTLMPTMSIIANKYLIPSISNAEKSKIINIHDIAVKANIIEKPNKAKNKAPIKEDTKSKKTDKGIWNNLTRLVC